MALTSGQLANLTDPTTFPGPISAVGAAGTFVTKSELYVLTDYLD